MAKKKKFGASLKQQVDLLPIVKEKAPKTISTNVSTGGMRSAVSSTAQSVAKSARQKAEEDRSARMRQGLSKTFSAVVRSGFNQKMSQPTRVKKGMFQSLGNALQPVKKNASTTANTRSTGAPIGQIKSSILAPIKQDIKDNPYDAVRKVGMKGSRNERKVYRPMWQRDEEGQVSSNQRRLENAARGGNRKAQVEAEMGRTKAQTRSGHTYDQYINAELNKKGLLGQDYILRSKDPSKEAMDYRKRYGFDKEALEAVQAIANNTPASGDYTERFNGQDNGSAIDRLKFGFGESYRARNIEDTLRRQYGVELSDEDQAKLDAVRGSGGYMVGNMLGQASQFALTAPLSGAVEGKLLAKVGLKGGKAAIKTTGDALKYAGARIGADQIVSAPVNILDALKSDNGEEFVKRLGLNTAMDIFFGGLTEIPGLRKNIHFVRGLEMNNAANATSNASQKLVAKVGAQRELRQAVEEAGDAARLEAIQNAEGTVGEFPSTDYAYRNGSDRANYDNMRNDMLGAIESQEAIGAGDVPNNIGIRAKARPYQPTTTPKTGVEKVLSDYNTSADELIARIEDPYFDDLQMLDNIADDLFPVGRKRSMEIDAERAYSDNLKAFEEDPALFDGYRPTREEAYMDVLSDNVVDELRRSQTPNVADDVARAVPAEQTAREATQQTARAVPADNTARRAAEPAETPNRIPDEWNDIPNVAEADEAPQDLMMANPHRKENTIPKASDQKTRKEVLFRGETADRNGAKETAEQVAEAPKKRNQVKGILGEEKPKTEEPKTKFSEMNDHELQSERYRYEEQSKYDKTAGTSEDRIAEIDEEFARRGKEPKWTRIEPEQGGKRVMSEEEVARAKKEQGEKYGTYENKTPKKTDTPDGAKRVHKTFDREVEKQSAEVQHEMGNELFGEHAHTSDGKTVDEFVEEFNNKFNENPEAYSRKLVDDDVEMDHRERQVGLFMAKGQWRDEVNSLERKLQKANLDADVKRSLEDRLATASEMERITTEKYVKIVPEAASILKIHGVLNKLSRHTKGEYIDETIRRMEKKYRKRLDKFGIDHIYVSDELRDALKNAKEPIEISQAWMEITAELWDQIPASMKEKLDFFRVNAMLFNLPTHVRNFAGNVLFAPLREAKNLQAAGLEKIAQKLNLIDQSDRTKAFIPKPALKKRGKELRKKYGEVINEGFKFFDDIADGRPHGRKVFMAGRQNGHGFAFMNGIRRGMDFLGNANLKALSAEDKVMFSSAFDTAFAREATARGLSPEDLINNPKLEQRIIEDAATEALRATFNDVSAFTRALNRIANPGENAHITRKIVGLFVNAIQPFIKVPVNILRRGIDYSPFGWGKGIYNIGKGWHMHDPKMITKGIDQLASGTTGTAVALTGWLLAKHDRINAQIGNDDDEMFMKDLGKQKFSIVLKKDGDKEFSYSIDWSQPGAIPLFWGVTLERISEEGLQNVNLWEVADLFEAAFEPVEELSVLQGLKNTSETFQDEDNWVKGIESVIINTGLQYVGQFLPTSVKRVARQVDPIRRDTSSHAEESTKRTVEKWWNKQRAGIPSNPVTDALHISSTSLPAYKNSWGEVQSNTYSKDWKGRVLENFVSPGYLKDYKPDEVDKFLLDMYNKDKTAKDLFPEKNWKGTVSFKGQNIKLTNDELDYYDRLAGQESKKEIKRRLDAGDFEGLSLSEQRKIVRDIYADANLKATQKTLLKQGEDPWDVYSDSLSDTQKNYKDIKATGIKPETYYQYATTDAHDLNENGYTSKAEWVMYLNKQDLTDEQRAALYPLRATGDNPYLDGTAYTKNWEKENEKNLSKSSKAAATKFEKATPRDAGSIAANLFDKSVIQRAGEMRAAAGGSSSGSSGSSGGSKKGRSGRRSGGGSGKVKARAKTESEKRFAALQKMKAPTTGKGIEALANSAKGLTKAQKKALIKLLQKKLEV